MRVLHPGRRIELKRQDMMWVEARVNPSEMQKTLNQQARAEQQGEGYGDLADNQSIAQATVLFTRSLPEARPIFSAIR